MTNVVQLIVSNFCSLQKCAVCSSSLWSWLWSPWLQRKSLFYLFLNLTTLTALYVCVCVYSRTDPRTMVSVDIPLHRNYAAYHLQRHQLMRINSALSEIRMKIENKIEAYLERDGLGEKLGEIVTIRTLL